MILFDEVLLMAGLSAPTSWCLTLLPTSAGCSLIIINLPQAQFNPNPKPGPNCRVFLESFVIGNLPQSAAVELVDAAHSALVRAFGTRDIFASQAKDQRVFQLPTGAASVYSDLVPNPTNDNSAVLVLLQASHVPAPIWDVGTAYHICFVFVGVRWCFVERIFLLACQFAVMINIPCCQRVFCFQFHACG